MSEQRMKRIDAVLNRRQQDLTVVMENVHKPHNLAAIARSCDAVGVMRVHAVGGAETLQLSQKSAGGVGKWVDLTQHSDLDSAFRVCRAGGMQLVAVSVSDGSRDFRDLDYTVPTAFVVGAELEGLSAKALSGCDESAHVPMSGMVESLNVSVATALLLFEARRQREARGGFGVTQLSINQRSRLRFEWAQPVIARYCRRHSLAYPELDENGDVVNWTPPRIVDNGVDESTSDKFTDSD